MTVPTSEAESFPPLLFRGVDRIEREQIGGLCRAVVYEDGETLVQEGDTGRDAFLVDRGTVRIEKTDGSGKVQILAEINGQTILGELGMILGGPRTATVRAVGQAHALLISGERFATLVREGNGAVLKMAYNILTVLARRQAAMNGHAMALIEQIEGKTGEGASPPATATAGAAMPGRGTDDVSSLREKLLAEWTF